MGFLDKFKAKRQSAGNVVPLVRAKPTPKPKAKAFKAEWVKLPMSWAEALQGSSGATYQLAIAILIEDFRQRRMGREIVLTTKTTGMSGSTRRKAANKMVQLGLIEIESDGRQAIRVKSLNQ